MTPSMHPPGNASVSRLRNMQVFEMTPQIGPPSQANNASVSRLKNMQVFEMAPASVHPPGDVNVSRTRNLQAYELTPLTHPPGDAYVTRTRNLQCFEMAYQIHEIIANIMYLAITDQNGNQTANFVKGDVVQMNFTIHSTGVPFGDALISTVILDPSSNVVFLSYTFRDFSIGTNENVIFGYRIPQDAPTGIYMAKVMVLTDWPSEGGVGLDIRTATFSVS